MSMFLILVLDNVQDKYIVNNVVFNVLRESGCIYLNLFLFILLDNILCKGRNYYFKYLKI